MKLWKHSAAWCAVIVLTCILSCGTSEPAEESPVVGGTYQLDRVRFPGKVAVCVTEDAMREYMDAKDSNNQDRVSKLLFEISTIDDLARMKKAGGCTLISSFSQAKITKKGIESHEAQFFAFAFSTVEPMWGHWLYFGGRVK